MIPTMKHSIFCAGLDQWQIWDIPQDRFVSEHKNLNDAENWLAVIDAREAVKTATRIHDDEPSFANAKVRWDASARLSSAMNRYEGK
jgi:hypothetical protein